MIKEGYIAKWKDYPGDEVKVRVAYPSCLGPSKELLTWYKKHERTTDWIEYERRFLEELSSNPKAVKRLRELAELSKTKDIRLICYEKSFPCHRFILMDIIGALNSWTGGPRAERLREAFGGPEYCSKVSKQEQSLEGPDS